MRRMCKLKDISLMTNGLLSPYKARLLFLQGELAGTRLGGENSPILIDLDFLDQYIEQQSLSNLKQTEPEEPGKIRRIN